MQINDLEINRLTVVSVLKEESYEKIDYQRGKLPLYVGFSGKTSLEQENLT